MPLELVCQNVFGRLIEAGCTLDIYICKTQIDVQFSNIWPFFTFSNRRPMENIHPNLLTVTLTVTLHYSDTIFPPH